MDSRSFDRLAAALGRASSRRAGLVAAVGAAFAAPLAAQAGPDAAGQCGKRKTSVCTKDGDCCSGRCVLATGKTNRDGLGRCRCSRRAERCGDDRDCCNRKDQGLVCHDGVCADPCVTLGAACNANSTCCAGRCTRETAAGSRAAATCCLPLDTRGCTADAYCCGAAICLAGVCANACLPLQSECGDGDTCCAGVCSARPITGRLAATTVCCLPSGSTGCSDDADCCTGGCCAGQCDEVGFGPTDC
ncbi:MAG: hypothetical protein ACKOWF_16480 [Chloroflexota bacterium]